MKIQPSPLVARLKGSAGPTTVANLHGKPYIKRRTPPRVTQKPAQVQQRHRVKAVAAWHPELDTGLLNWIDYLNTGLEHSPINAFITQQLRDLSAYGEPRIVKPNSYVKPVTSITTLQHANPYGLTLGWTAGDADPDHKPYLIYAEPPNDTSLPLHILGYIISPWTIEHGFTVFSMPKQITLYWLALLVKMPGGHQYSIARTAWELSGPRP